MEQRKNTMTVNRPKKAVRSKRRKTMIILMSVLCVLMALLLGFGAFVWINYDRLRGDLGFDPNNIGEEFETDLDAGDLPEVTYSEGNVPSMDKNQGVIDIMLIGVDNRDITKFTGRSDVLMYLRIDKNNNKLKLVSIMRDTLVPIKGHDHNKINTAYMFGSTELAKETLSKNLGLSPDHYMVVNFYGMEDIIDALGGVDIELERNELSNLNTSIDEINKLDPDNRASHVKKSGVQHLNGRQAVAYMRIRKIGGDQARVVRQQNVLSELFNTAKDMDLGKLTGLAGTLTKYVRTDMDLGSMIDMATTVMGMQNSKIDKFRYPDELKLGRYKGMSIVQPKDFDEDIKKLHDFLDG